MNKWINKGPGQPNSLQQQREHRWAMRKSLWSLQASGDITFLVTSTPEHLLICGLGLTPSALCLPVFNKKIGQYLLSEKWQLLAHFSHWLSTLRSQKYFPTHCLNSCCLKSHEVGNSHFIEEETEAERIKMTFWGAGLCLEPGALAPHAQCPFCCTALSTVQIHMAGDLESALALRELTYQ